MLNVACHFICSLWLSLTDFYYWKYCYKHFSVIIWFTQRKGGLELTFDMELAVSFWGQLLDCLWGRVHIKTYCYFIVVCIFCLAGVFLLEVYWFQEGFRVKYLGPFLHFSRDLSFSFNDFEEGT